MGAGFEYTQLSQSRVNTIVGIFHTTIISSYLLERNDTTSSNRSKSQPIGSCNTYSAPISIDLSFNLICPISFFFCSSLVVIVVLRHSHNKNEARSHIFNPIYIYRRQRIRYHVHCIIDHLTVEVVTSINNFCVVFALSAGSWGGKEIKESTLYINKTLISYLNNSMIAKGLNI